MGRHYAFDILAELSDMLVLMIEETDRMRLLSKDNDVLKIRFSRTDLERIFIILSQPECIDSDYRDSCGISSADIEWLQEWAAHAIAAEDGSLLTVAIPSAQLDRMYSFILFADESSSVLGGIKGMDDEEIVDIEERLSRIVDLVFPR